MERWNSFWNFMLQQSDKIFDQTLTHTGLTFISLLLALLIGFPLGMLIARRRRLAAPVLGVAGVLQTIPSIALLGFMIPLLGIGPLPAITALFLYALLPIIRNTYTGITEVDIAVREAARGMGMSPAQVLFRVELPLAMPVILAGIRTATVINVGVATLAAYIAAGGLGEFIFGGIALNNSDMILAGAIPAALLAIIFDQLLAFFQRMPFRKMRNILRLLPIAIIVLSSFYIIPKAGAGMLAGFTPEFMGRQDGYLGLRAVYGLSIRNVVISDAVMYKAAFEKKLDVISGYSTDGRLKAYELVTLVDDRNIFPPYDAAPLVSQKALQLYPGLDHTLNLLAGKINDSVMTALNYEVDQKKLLPAVVARKFLEENGLYRPSRNPKGATIRIGSKIFGEQYILVNMYALLIRGYTDYEVDLKTGLGGTKICFDALLNDQIDLYPEYTGTGLLVILQAQNSRDSDPQRVYAEVRQRFREKFHLEWLRPIGFNNSYALMMRKKDAAEKNIKTISDLKRYLENEQ